MLTKLNKIKNWQAAVIIAVTGFAVYFDGLKNQFQGDDYTQIVNNTVVHSLSHIRLFFNGGTFYTYSSGELSHLSGVYYRPLMTTTYSLLYILFGPHPFYYHLLQLLLCIGSTFILYLFFRYSFKPFLSLFLALVFLVHPIDSQVIYAIPSMQDALFFFFGILGLYLLFRYKSFRSLFAVACCFFLSLLSKETGIVFVAMAFLYLFWFSRKRIYNFIVIMIVPVVLWIILKAHAVGLNSNPHNAPIDNLNFAGRLLTDPSIILFYITQFIFPWKLASAYYWIHPHYSFSHVLLPLIIDLIVIGFFIYGGIHIHRKASRAKYLSYIFFAVWTALGLGMLLQVFPLDMTACATWFYFPMVGVLGMIGVIISSRIIHVRSTWLPCVIAIAIIGILGLRSAIGGLDWRSQYTLSKNDVSVPNSDDYTAIGNIAVYYIGQANYTQAQIYAARSVSIYPTASDYFNLGVIDADLGEYANAQSAYETGLKYGPISSIYQNLGALTLVYGTPSFDNNFFKKALTKYPQSANLWMYYAIFEYRSDNAKEAKIAITQAADIGQVPQFIYSGIMNNESITIELSGTGKSIHIQSIN